MGNIGTRWLAVDGALEARFKRLDYETSEESQLPLQ